MQMTELESARIKLEQAKENLKYWVKTVEQCELESKALKGDDPAGILGKVFGIGKTIVYITGYAGGQYQATEFNIDAVNRSIPVPRDGDYPVRELDPAIIFDECKGINRYIQDIVDNPLFGLQERVKINTVSPT